jgi:hypothetical protein
LDSAALEIVGVNQAYAVLGFDDHTSIFNRRSLYSINLSTGATTPATSDLGLLNNIIDFAALTRSAS